MSFQQGLSGLNASSKALDAISNNVANSGTVGFKGATAHFADVYAASLTGGGASNIGIGTALSAVPQNFTQGNLTTTNNPLDLAINGGGFFRLSQSGAILYSRNGQFHLDKDGYVVTDRGLRLTGYGVDTSGQVTSQLGDILVDSSDIPPLATGASTGTGVRGVGAVLNLDSREGTLSAAAFDQNDPLTYNYSTGLNVYDTLGNPHIMTMYFIKTADNTWALRYRVDNTTVGGSGTLAFDTSGALTTAMPLAASLDLATAGTDNGAASPLAFNLDFTGTSQYGSSFSTSRLTQDGYASGRLSGLSVGSDGVVLGRYTNGQSRNLAQVALANFTNPNGLQSLGNNVWADSADSGPPLVGAPATGSLGVIQSSAVEESNVDLTAELVNMITQQRAYQANAQSIKTQDQVLQTLVNLR